MVEKYRGGVRGGDRGGRERGRAETETETGKPYYLDWEATRLSCVIEFARLCFHARSLIVVVASSALRPLRCLVTSRQKSKIEN